ncbi:hypothetical protein, partial [Enterobacter asburiae]|uniref:hypothetical protein n=1 Tax=Enterobacter asburiae TaxID=61645 RepID=UPI001F1556CA
RDLSELTNLGRETFATTMSFNKLVSGEAPDKALILSHKLKSNQSISDKLTVQQHSSDFSNCY